MKSPPGLRPPEVFNVLTHLAGAVLATAGLVYLLVRAESPRAQVAFAAYGVSLVLLYAASTLYHGLSLRQDASPRFRRVDHVCIFLLIAGTYTPPCLLAVPARWGVPLLAAVWLVGLAGMAQKILRPFAHRWVSVSLYLAMGWMAVLLLPVMVAHIPRAGVLLVAAGGLVYTLGAVVYATRWPDLLPRRVGFHGVFHLLVLAGSALHFAFEAVYVPAQ